MVDKSVARHSDGSSSRKDLSSRTTSRPTTQISVKRTTGSFRILWCTRGASFFHFSIFFIMFATTAVSATVSNVFHKSVAAVKSWISKPSDASYEPKPKRTRAHVEIWIMLHLSTSTHWWGKPMLSDLRSHLNRATYRLTEEERQLWLAKQKQSRKNI